MKKDGYVSMLAAALVGAGLMTVPVNSEPPPCEDTITGGGWIVTEAGTGNYGVSGGEIGGELSTPFSLNYVDEEADVHVVATAIVAYDGEGTCRTISYEVTLNGEPGFCATVEVCDNSEPGTEDTFAITVYGSDAATCPCVENTETEEIECPVAYEASGVLIGGNNQLHQRHCD